mmetsp:Transcript_18372/g.53050  ORF Transcript_18372/g.53050 Transcript_18372/m.53050 type:complete len:264 (-) Transcript_18372:289-1080(-)
MIFSTPIENFPVIVKVVFPQRVLRQVFHRNMGTKVEIVDHLTELMSSRWLNPTPSLRFQLMLPCESETIILRIALWAKAVLAGGTRRRVRTGLVSSSWRRSYFRSFSWRRFPAQIPLGHELHFTGRNLNRGVRTQVKNRLFRFGMKEHGPSIHTQVSRGLFPRNHVKFLRWTRPIALKDWNLGGCRRTTSRSSCHWRRVWCRGGFFRDRNSSHAVIRRLRSRSSSSHWRVRRKSPGNRGGSGRRKGGRITRSHSCGHGIRSRH